MRIFNPFTHIERLRSKKGFALLFAVLLITLILNIGIGISSITYKEIILSGLASDSQLAFYQADAAVECGLYYDITLNYYPLGTTVDTVQNQPDPKINAFNCGKDQYTIDPAQSYTNYFVFTKGQAQAEPSDPCFEIIFDKTGTGSSVQGNGFNRCAYSSKQVERTLKVVY